MNFKEESGCPCSVSAESWSQTEISNDNYQQINYIWFISDLVLRKVYMKIKIKLQFKMNENFLKCGIALMFWAAAALVFISSHIAGAISCSLKGKCGENITISHVISPSF